jgi:hypothetical protein
MPSLHKTDAGPLRRRIPAPSKSESARYTYDMLISLKKISTLREEAQLMRLIDAAAEEARVVSESRRRL